MRPAYAIVLALSVVMALPAASLARDDGPDPLARGLSSARQALLMGDADEAARLYREVLDAYPDDLRAFWGLVGAYAAAGLDREQLVPLLLRRIEEHPEDLRAKKELGVAYARLGEKESAHRIWMQTLHHGRPDGALYVEIGGLELAHDMIDEAIETYEDGRIALESPSFFARELVQAYTLLGDYGKAMDECFVVVVEHSGLVQWAVNRIEAMLDRGVSRGDVVEKVASIVAEPACGSAEAGLAGSVLLVLGLPDEASHAFLRADEAAADQGRVLLEYAKVMREVGRIEEARELYLAVGDRHPGSVNAAMAAVESGLILARTGRVEEAVAELKAAGAEHPAHAAGGQAVLAAARLELVERHDPESALETIDALVAAGRGGDAELVREARLLRSDAYMAVARYEDSHEEARLVLNGRARGPVRERAMFNMGFASFLMEKRRVALDEFREMVEANTSGELANDALRIMLVIAEGEEELGPQPASLLARAHGARLRGDLRSAAGFVEQIAAGYRGSAAATEALLLSGTIAEGAGEPQRALDIYRRVADEAVMVSARAEALMRSGDILLGDLGRPDDSRAAYAAILEELPENALSGEARRKIERIRKATGRDG